MIPLRDDVRARTVPVVNVALICINALAFFYELSLGPQLDRFFKQSAVVPILYTGCERVIRGEVGYYTRCDGRLSASDVVQSAVTPDLAMRVVYSMFLHGGWAHILGNMLYLWIFGDNVEDRMGHVRYLVFYLACGAIASYAHVWSSPDSQIPSIGASGAIAGVLGAYITLYPRARVVTLLPLGLFTQLVQIPALFFLGLWFVQQFVAGALSLGARTAQTGGVAWWAHIGGFVAGFALVWLFQSPSRRPPARDTWWRDSHPERRVRGW